VLPSANLRTPRAATPEQSNRCHRRYVASHRPGQHRRRAPRHRPAGIDRPGSRCSTQPAPALADDWARSGRGARPLHPAGPRAASLGVTTRDDRRLVDLDSDTYSEPDGLRQFAVQRQRRRHGAGVAAGRWHSGRGAAARPQGGVNAVAAGALPGRLPGPTPTEILRACRGPSC
jgi:hypothetical protein